MTRVARTALTLAAAVLMTACTSGESKQAARSSPAASPTLAPCLTASATGCDKSKLTGGRGSAACVGSGTGVIKASPIAIADMAYIQPMGLMIGGHVTPIDHGYFYIKGALANPAREAPVYSPIDGNIATVTRTVRNGGPGQGATYDDAAITIEASCTFRVRFSNLLRFGGTLGNTIGQLQANETKSPNYAVRAGELIGYTGLPTAYGIDVWVENDNLTLPGFVNPAQYTAAEAWKTHVADLFDYTEEPLRGQLLALDERDAAPRWGQIGYDVDGKLVGTWFRVGSGGYGGLQHMGEGYWVGHLSVVYDGNDPGQIIVSLGDYNGMAAQFAVVGNRPDPASVDETTGLIRYELGQIEWYSGVTGEPWNHQSYVQHVRTRAGSSVSGTVLMQLVGTRSLKFEAFPGKPASQVAGFDSGAVLYER